MRTRRPSFLSAALAVLILSLSLAAAADAQEKAAASPSAAGVYNLDVAHTSVGFMVRHLVSKVPGRFTVFGGTIRFDPADLASTQVSVDIDVSSINTDNAKRDEHLRGPDFFDAAEHPKITFRSKGVKAVDEARATMTGDLTIRGVTKPVTLDVEVLGVSTGSRGESRAGFEARGKIDRMDYGVSWNRALEGGGALLGDDVELVLMVEAIKPAAEAGK